MSIKSILARPRGTNAIPIRTRTTPLQFMTLALLVQRSIHDIVSFGFDEETVDVEDFGGEGEGFEIDLFTFGVFYVG